MPTSARTNSSSTRWRGMNLLTSTFVVTEQRQNSGSIRSGLRHQGDSPTPIFGLYKNLWKKTKSKLWRHGMTTLLIERDVFAVDCFGPVFSTGKGFTWESVRGNLYTQAEEKGESPGRPLRQDRIEPGDYREKPFELYQKTTKIFPCPSPVFSAKARFVSTASASDAAFFSERSVRTL